MLNKQSLLSLLSPWIESKSLESNQHDALQDIQVVNLELDSRKVLKGDTFVAILGHAVDGRSFMGKAIEQGANAVIAQASEEHMHGSVEYRTGCPIVYIDQLDLYLSELSSRLYKCHSKLIGVTGTNGKTTITQLIAQWLELLEKRSVVMGTTGNGFLDNLQVSTNTTGSAIDIHRTLANLSDLGAEYAALEISSHGLVQGRVKTLPFSAGVFTNLSRDHLDYHGTMEAYAQAKLTLFTQHCCEKIVINADDKVGADWLNELPEAIAVSIINEPSQANSLWARNIQYSDAGIQLSIDGHWGKGELSVPLIGEFNASNVLLGLAALLSLGFDKQELLASAKSLQPVIGRMELFQATDKAKIVVDYAHTPDALEKALMALRVHCSGKLWVIFGCGGDRDTGKRPIMAEIAERLADHVMLTDDNPRSEDPEIIFKDMLAGLNKPELARLEHDRYHALKLASENASSNDIILLAGKGHEDYQVLKNETIHYSDRDSAARLLGIIQ
ncbi:UDP-N-acetylmuramoyl-L-alanyl-D-glutamate--2,6-diaminopimelate ligase [Vibrio algarum]|uniref:UDP-N-acetylmuramoyl-L-alanyl-D-glutamate--2,6-diaminopimelate ligase n=1 Tax=Vibrio algarum TaxID=3020714 RepID=A0ABT4YN98_9VIBR|nr:UDP-N-acetylmuramoyl-L-alanyl-D-glutamate--2,6-diaminopimelate ligase [Vibrio sp. KJ40-1]MDB1122993.1 UDP-N-acetylmuramoyl-L-alanyl-D-glutamate--2,6-diaminopimelate ligase [Vibrio sp. KJ40-1]